MTSKEELRMLIIKIEKKLIELGYKKIFDYDYKEFTKKSHYYEISITITPFNNRYEIDSGIVAKYKIIDQADINNIQLAFNELQEDLQELENDC